MIDLDGNEMSLSADAERVAADLAALGARLTSGYRHLAKQAYVMAVNTMENRGWIGQTYLRGEGIQRALNTHPEWDTTEEVSQQIFHYLSDHPVLAKTISHHLIYPSPCFDIAVQSVNEAVKVRIAEYQREGVITKVLWQEGGLSRCHVEVAALPNIKVEEV